MAEPRFKDVNRFDSRELSSNRIRAPASKRIESVQVAPRIASSEILVQTQLINRGPAGEFLLRHSVTPARGTEIVARGEPVRVQLATGETRTLTESIRVPGARLWSPEHPNLYRLETRPDGDSVRTRFGMRDSMLMISGTESRPRQTACLYVYVNDVDEVFERSVTAGGKVIEAPTLMPWGQALHRRGQLGQRVADRDAVARWYGDRSDELKPS